MLSRGHCPLVGLLGLILTLLAASSAGAAPGAVHHRMPESLNREGRYVIYLHGRIIEDSGPRPTHPEFGVYEYASILARLAEDGLEVISEVRPAGTDVRDYASRVVEQVEALNAGGIPMQRITVIGFSKGAAIALHAASRMARPDARFVLMAICGDWMDDVPDLEVHGRILSIYEASDEIGSSCRRLIHGPADGIELAEVRIDTGERHGAFYRPREEWLTPLIAWILQ